MSELCPVCETSLKKAEERASEDRWYLECPRCGPFSVVSSLMPWLKGKIRQEANGPARVSYAVRRMTNVQLWPLLHSQLVDDLLRSVRVPRPAEQLDLFVQWLGDNQPEYGDGVRCDEHSIAATIGAGSKAGLGFVLLEASSRELISTKIQQMMNGDVVPIGNLKLTFKGWALYEEIQRGHTASRTAFMAMKFGDSELDQIFRNTLRSSS